jgi:hypothetical protein
MNDTRQARTDISETNGTYNGTYTSPDRALLKILGVSSPTNRDHRATSLAEAEGAGVPFS